MQRMGTGVRNAATVKNPLSGITIAANLQAGKTWLATYKADFDAGITPQLFIGEREMSKKSCEFDVDCKPTQMYALMQPTLRESRSTRQAGKCPGMLTCCQAGRAARLGGTPLSCLTRMITARTCRRARPLQQHQPLLPPATARYVAGKLHLVQMSSLFVRPSAMPATLVIMLQFVCRCSLLWPTGRRPQEGQRLRRRRAVERRRRRRPSTGGRDQRGRLAGLPRSNHPLRVQVCMVIAMKCEPREYGHIYISSHALPDINRI